MGPWGAMIFGLSGGVYAAWAIVLADGWRSAWLAIPIAVFVAIVVAAVRRLRRAPPGAYELGPRASRVIGRATIFESVGIPVVALLLANTGHGDIVLSGIALIVGLHFLPIARALPFAPFLLLAFVLVAVAIVGAAMTQPTGSIVVGAVAACTMWIAAVAALLRAPLAVATR